MSVFEDSITPFNASTSLYDQSSLGDMGDLGGGVSEWVSKLTSGLGFGSGGNAATTTTGKPDQGGTTPVKTPQGIFPSGWFGDIMNGVISNSGSLMTMYNEYQTGQDEAQYRKEMRNRLREKMSGNILQETGALQQQVQPAVDPALWAQMMSQAGGTKRFGNGDDDGKNKTTQTILLVGAGGLALVTILMLAMRKKK